MVYGIAAVEVLAIPAICPVNVLNDRAAGNVGEIPKVYAVYPPVAVTGVTGVIVTPLMKVLDVRTSVVVNAGGVTVSANVLLLVCNA